MKTQIILLILLISCTPLEPITAPHIQIITDCSATQKLGESCTHTCQCLLPAECLKNSCTLTKLTDNSPCTEHKQCLSGYCTQLGQCGGPNSTRPLECKYSCRTDSTTLENFCYTTCKR